MEDGKQAANKLVMVEIIVETKCRAVLLEVVAGIGRYRQWKAWYAHPVVDCIR